MSVSVSVSVCVCVCVCVCVRECVCVCASYLWGVSTILGHQLFQCAHLQEDDVLSTVWDGSDLLSLETQQVNGKTKHIHYKDTVL